MTKDAAPAQLSPQQERNRRIQKVDDKISDLRDAHNEHCDDVADEIRRKQRVIQKTHREKMKALENERRTELEELETQREAAVAESLAATNKKIEALQEERAAL